MTERQPCAHCGTPIVESGTYGWLHVGGWRVCWPALTATPEAAPASAHPCDAHTVLEDEAGAGLVLAGLVFCDRELNHEPPHRSLIEWAT